MGKFKRSKEASLDLPPPPKRKTATTKEADPPVWEQHHIHFDGKTYEPEHDKARLTGQLGRVYGLMKDRQFRTLEAIAKATGDPQAAISARLRDLRKPRFGGHTVSRRSLGKRASGLYEYQVS